MQKIRLKIPKTWVEIQINCVIMFVEIFCWKCRLHKNDDGNFGVHFSRSPTENWRSTKTMQFSIDLTTYILKSPFFTAFLADRIAYRLRFWVIGQRVIRMNRRDAQMRNVRLNDFTCLLMNRFIVMMQLYQISWYLI